MSIDFLAIGVLLLIFVLGTVKPVNIGALALVAALGVGTVALGEDLPTILSGFPANQFLLLIGITYLFSVAGANGTTEWLVRAMAGMVRGNARVVPLLLFLATAAVVTAGAPGQAAVGIMAPIGVRLAMEFGIRPLLSGLMVILGSCAGTFSPLSTLGIVANSAVEAGNVPVNPIMLWLGTLAFNTALAVVVLLVLVGLRRVTQEIPGSMTPAVPPQDATSGGTAGSSPISSVIVAERVQPTKVKLDAARACTLVAIMLVAGGSLVLGYDIGMLAITAAVVLHLVFPRPDSAAHISWNVILLVCGIVTFIGVLDRAGSISRIGEGVAGLGAPIVSALLLCMVASLVSAFASSTGVLGALVPLGVPLMLSGGLSPLGLLIAIGLSATIVDASPFSSLGALATASAPADQQRTLSRQFLVFGVSMIVIAPVLSVLIFVVPSALG